MLVSWRVHSSKIWHKKKQDIPIHEIIPTNCMSEADTPWKINGWNLQPSPIWKGKWSSKPLWLCSMLIFTRICLWEGSLYLNVNLIHISIKYLMRSNCHASEWHSWNLMGMICKMITLWPYAPGIAIELRIDRIPGEGSIRGFWCCLVGSVISGWPKFPPKQNASKPEGQPKI